MSNDFVHLHTHSEYSLLDGLGRIDDLVSEAARLGHKALALTDHGAMHGVIEFYRACRNAEIKPIIGVEAYQTLWQRPMGGRDPQLDRENYHLLLLARNMTGYRNILKIVSRSNTDGFYYKPRVDHEFLAAHAEGILCTTGCLGAEVPALLSQGKEREAYERLGWYKDVFGKENFFIEVQEHDIPELQEVNRTLIPWADKFDLDLLVTNDVHYVSESDASPHEVLLCVQTNAKLNDDKRMRLSDQSYFLKSRQQMEDTFRPLLDLPASAFDNTLLVAEKCDLDLEDDNYHLPDMEIPEGFNYETYLRHLTDQGVQRLYGDRANEEEVQERKERELRIIHEMGFDVYFLIVADLCDFARSRNIWWTLRGSGAGSLVAYSIGITGLDPIHNNLIFERFLNPGRVTMPDFDLDFPDDQREEMIRYTVEKYGANQVAQIATFGRMKARAAIRDVGRAQDISLDDVDRIAKMIPAIPGNPATIQDVLTEGHEFYDQELKELYGKDGWERSLLDTSMQLEGVARHAGIHAAAVIVADKDLTNYTPLMRGSRGSITETITQFEFPVLESLGLLKIDFLGLSTLTVMREACRLIKEHHGIQYGLDSIPIEGPEAEPAFRLLSSGEVSGVFQVESPGMRRVLTEMKPNTFEHIIATISLYRPGPMEYIPNYIRRMHGEEEMEVKHPALKPILAETFGIIVYQEQIIQILNQLADYTPGEADLVRQAVSKKDASKIEYHKALFIGGCGKNGISASDAQAIYADIEFFARYGFNKAHAADYAVITVQTAYLKANYPVEYMAALLLVERDKTEKVITFIQECRRMGIHVLPPDVNYSGLDFAIQDLPADADQETLPKDPTLAYDFPVSVGSAIRFGMAAVKNVGVGPVQAILEARAEGGPFTNLEDLCDRVDLRQVNKRSLECLIKVGAFDSFGRQSEQGKGQLRRQLLSVIDQCIARSAATHSARESGQLSMFDLFADADGEAHPEQFPIRLPEYEAAGARTSDRERFAWEKELLGVYVSSHPVQQLNVDLNRFTTCPCPELDERHDGKNVSLVGMVASIRTTVTKKGDRMAFVQLEDIQGQCEAVFFPAVYEECKENLLEEKVVMVKGKAQTRGGRTSVLVDSLHTSIEFGEAKVEEKHTTVAEGWDAAPAAWPNGSDFEYMPPPDDSVSERPPIDMTAPPFDVEDAGGQEAPGEEAAPEITTDSEYQSDPPGIATGILAENGQETPTSPLSDGPAGQERTDTEAEEPGTNEDPAHGGSVSEPPAPEAQAPMFKGGPAGATYATDSEESIAVPPAENGCQLLRITFSRSGQFSRDKYRLREIFDAVRDPKGRDQFIVVLVTNGSRHQLTFPNEYCKVSPRLLKDLRDHFKVEVTVEDQH
ncbi:MAG: DNA polymerase III subunit alpha [Caldilineaceae bacterium SB0670_bin_27]|uniref:DNA polymerase III subunit alpha n=1 Tax=Caldilineaceae bacterium SB0664_bin_27 TaxID=2605260 RepID=A0A6B0YS68_9CHLR|nr:DNA polymerase III subunit alpha [Caldilineaceae bacterium SB0664_bin_27]MYJ77647.1 DNA polymerase III subunit alpha [Caldilineaceae bacterium SB0670_bin_27]